MIEISRKTFAKDPSRKLVIGWYEDVCGIVYYPDENIDHGIIICAYDSMRSQQLRCYELNDLELHNMITPRII